VSALKYRPDIDGLRALAVLSVVIYHVSPHSLPGGFLGVDIFFVISGYLISLIVFREQAAGTFSFVDFYVRRIRRLLPALAAVLLAVLVFGAFALFADEYRRLGKHALASIVFMLNFQLMSETGYFDVVSDAKPLLHLWSLSIEEQFYLLWPALLIMFGRIRWRVGLIIVLLCISSLFFSIYLAESNRDTLYFHPVARFWELLIGAALAYHHHRFGVNALPPIIDNVWMRHALSVIGLTAVIWALLGFNGKMPHPGMLTLVPLLGAALLIASGGAAVVDRVLALKPVVWIGLISYPLYLWHWPVLSYIRIMESGTPSKFFLFVGVGVSMLLAALTYQFIEKPLSKVQYARGALVSICGVMAMIFIASASVVALDGLPERSSVAYVKAAKIQMKRDSATDQSCLNLFPVGDAPTYCRQHNPNKRMIGIIGDSHAHVLFPGTSELAQQSGYGTLLLANSGCPPLVGALTGRNAAELEVCSKNIDRIINAISENKNIEYIIIATRGPQYLNGLGFGPAEANYNHPPITSKYPIKSINKAETAFINGLENTVNILNQKNIKIAYLLQVPELGMTSQDCLGRPFKLINSSKSCTVDINVYKERMSSYRKLILNLTKKIPNLKIIDTENAFCTDIYCSGFIDNQLLYADDNHLSVAGSKWIAQHISDASFGEHALK
jgi:peptidoglycan/LPS O-acetylase OafA/YrhL